MTLCGWLTGVEPLRMTSALTAGIATEAVSAADARRRHARTEAILALLQASVAFAFGIGAYIGVFEIASPVREICVAFVWLYHVGLTAYAFSYRVRGQALPWLEPILPLFDVTCATAVYIAIGDPVSPVWAIYLYALIGYSRRFHSVRYAWVALYTIANMVLGWAIIGGTDDGQFAIMVTLAVVIGVLAFTISDSWRDAESRIREFAETDALTGVANRRAFFSKLEALAGMPVGILMFDLDNFKRLNDELGHQAGDRVLQNAAKAIAENLPGPGFAGRYGGEEFIAAIPGIDAPSMKLVAEQIRQAVAAATPTTVSIGSTLLRPGESLDDAIKRADELLFVAKRSGRNQVIAEDILRWVA